MPNLGDAVGSSVIFQPLLINFCRGCEGLVTLLIGDVPTRPQRFPAALGTRRSAIDHRGDR